MSKKPPHPIAFAKIVLRGASRKWYARNEVLIRCRVGRGIYRCEGCGETFKKQQIQIDHIDPVVDIKEGYTTLDNWVARLFVGPEGLQALCFNEDAITGETWGCHPQKTKSEAEMRAFYKEQKKPKKEKKK